MKKFLSLVLALVMTMSLVTISAGAKDFTDDSKITYDEAVDVISAVKVVDGYTDGSFNPNATLTRGAAAKIICNLILGPTTAGALKADAAPYSDVPANSTFAGYIAYCQKEGIISGYADGTFKPGNSLTGYAFMKMLLGALGYDKAVEGYEGANWSINVAKRALNIGLDKGLTDDFDGTKPVTREEAALYAFNTLKATMVEYDSTIIVGDVTIAGSKAQDVKNDAAASKQYNGSNDGKMQFCEKYFSNLKKVSTTDAFERPATEWKLKSKSIGTYVDEADETYTTEVKLGTIYSDLGMSKAMAAANLTFHVDGAIESASGNDVDGNALSGLDLSKGLTNKIGGNGILTEVFYDADDGKATITMIHTYAGKVTSVHPETSTRDAYISIAPAASGVGTAGNFDTEDSYKVDDIVLYNYSVKSGEGIKNVAIAESVTGVVKAFTNSKDVTLDGTVYASNKAYASKITSLTGSVGYEAEAYLDTNGYVVFLDTSKSSSNYAVVLANDTNTLDGNRAKLLFADGTTKVVNLKAGTTVNAYNAAASALSDGDIVSYAVDGNGKYSLTLLADGFNATATTVITKNSAAVHTDNDNANYYAVSNRDQASSFSGKTLFLIASKSGSSTVYNAYTGIANVPTVTLNSGSKMAIYVKTLDNHTPKTGVATVVYVDATNAGDTVTATSKDVVFVKGSSVGSSYTSDKGTYYVYDAIVNGEFKKIETVTATTADTLYSTVTYDKNGIATLDNGVNSGNATYNNTTNGATYSTSGTMPEANGVIGVNGSYYPYADDVKVFYKNNDGDMSVSSISAIAEDDNDNVFVKYVDGEVTTIVIVEVLPGATPTSSYSVAGTPTVTIDNSDSKLTLGGTWKVQNNGTNADATNVSIKVDLSVWNPTTGTWNAPTTYTLTGSDATGTVTAGTTLAGTANVSLPTSTTYKVVVNFTSTEVSKTYNYQGVVQA